jgi:DNA transposition AAA+ family ATPase
MSRINGASPSITTWDRPEPSPEFVAKHPPKEVATWRILRDSVLDVARSNGWTKAEVARRMGMPEGSFSPWLSGKLLGVLANQNTMISRWLEAIEESAGLASTIPISPAFIRTTVAHDVTSTLNMAQMTAGLVMITLDAGRGKTHSCRYYAATRPHVYMATISPNTKTVHGMLNELAAELDIREFNPANLVRAIGRKLQRVGDGTLLIIDEAQNLVADAVNQIRHFPDNFGCGVALVGNSEIAKRFGREVKSTSSKAQVTSRFDKHLKNDRDIEGDIRMFINAWGVEDPACVKFLFGIGMKGGALRQIDRTLKLAHMSAAGANEELQLKHIQAAWKNRDVEDMG